MVVERPVFCSVTFTLALGTAPPAGSVTWPEIVPVAFTCAERGSAKIKTHTSENRCNNMVDALSSNPPSPAPSR